MDTLCGAGVLLPVDAAWETPRRRPPFERPVPRRSPTPSAPQSLPLHFGQRQQQQQQQPQPVAAPTVVEGTLVFSDQCLLCRSEHDSCDNNNGSSVVNRGNNCLCVTICEACVANGWWQHYIESSAATAALALEANEDPFTGLPREGPESYRAWVEAHDARPRCLRCHAHRVDFLFPVARPRRSTRNQRRRCCLFCLD